MCNRIAKHAVVITTSLLSISCTAEGYFEVFHEPTTYISQRPPAVVYRAPSPYYPYSPPKYRHGPPPVYIYEAPAIIYDAPAIVYDTFSYPHTSDVFIQLP